jgi:PAS domain S-box-containing protein
MPDQLFQHAFDHAAIGMALVSPDGRFLRVNHSLCQIVGYEESELLALTFQDITHADDMDADLELLRQLLADDIQTYQMEKRYRHKEGRTVWILLSVTLVRKADGEPKFAISQIQDITAQKEAQQRLLDTLAEKELLLSDLSRSSDMIRKLQGELITICAWTKQVRKGDDWQPIERFLTEHLQLNLTHGISQQAADAAMEELRVQEAKEKKKRA